MDERLHLVVAIDCTGLEIPSYHLSIPLEYRQNGFPGSPVASRPQQLQLHCEAEGSRPHLLPRAPQPHPAPQLQGKMIIQHRRCSYRPGAQQPPKNSRRKQPAEATKIDKDETASRQTANFSWPALCPDHPTRPGLRPPHCPNVPTSAPKQHSLQLVSRP